MTQIPPYAAAILQGTAVQQRSEAEKERNVRRLQNLARNAALTGDALDHQVESSDKSPTAGDDGGAGQGAAYYSSSSGEQQQPQDEGPERKPGQSPGRLDIRA